MAESEQPFDPAREKLNHDGFKPDEHTDNPVITNILCMVEQCQKGTLDEQLSFLVAIWNEVYANANQLPSIEQFFLGLFKETCKVVFSEQWSNVNVNLRQRLAYAISRCGEKLSVIVQQAQKLSSALVIAVFTPWVEDAFSYDFLKNEPVEMVLARVEYLLSKGNEEGATALCENYFRLQRKSSNSQQFCSDGCNNVSEGDSTPASLYSPSSPEEPDLMPLLERFVLMLFRKNRITDIVKATCQCNCHQGVRLVRGVQKSRFPESTALAQVLTHLFLVQDLHFPSTYCCTQELMGLWCWLQAQQGTSLRKVHEAAKKLVVQHASNSAHFYLFVDMLWEQFGYRLLPLYLELYIIGLTTDINHLENVRNTQTNLLAMELETHIAGVFVKLSSLFINGQDVLARECLLSAFSLEPTPERLLQLDELYQAVEKRSDSESRVRNEGSLATCMEINTEGLASIIKEHVQQNSSTDNTLQSECRPRTECRCEGRCSTPTELCDSLDCFKFDHPILDHEFPGISTILLKDLVTVVEGIRHVMLRSPNTWNVLRPICEAHLDVVSALHVMIKQSQSVDDSADSETDSKTEEESVHNVDARSVHSEASSFLLHSHMESAFGEFSRLDTVENKERSKMIRYLTTAGLGNKKKRKKKKRRAHKDKEKKIGADTPKKTVKKMKKADKEENKSVHEKIVQDEPATLGLPLVSSKMYPLDNNGLQTTNNPGSLDNASQSSLRPINEIQTTVQATVALKKNKTLPTSKTVHKTSSKSVVKMKSKSKLVLKNHKHMTKKRKKALKQLVMKRRSLVHAQVQTDVTLAADALVGPNFSLITPVPSFVALKGPMIPETDYGLNFPSNLTVVPSKKDFMPVFKGTMSSFTNTLTDTQAPRCRVYKNPVYYPIDCKYSLPSEKTQTLQTASLSTSVASVVKYSAPCRNSVMSPSVVVSEGSVPVQKSTPKLAQTRPNQKVIAIQQVLTSGKTSNPGVALQFAASTTQATVHIPISNGMHTVRNKKVIPSILLPKGTAGVKPVLAKQLPSMGNRIVIQKSAGSGSAPLAVPSLVLVQQSNVLDKSVKTKTEPAKRKPWTHVQSHPGKFLYQKTPNHEPAYVTVARCALPTTTSFCIGTATSSSNVNVAQPVLTSVFQSTNQTVKRNENSQEPAALEKKTGSSKVTRDVQKPNHLVKQRKIVLEKPLHIVETKKLFKSHAKVLPSVVVPEQSAKVLTTLLEQPKRVEPVKTIQTCTGTGGITNIGDSATGTSLFTPNQTLNIQPSICTTDPTVQNEQTIKHIQATIQDGFVVNSMILQSPCEASNSEGETITVYAADHVNIANPVVSSVGGLPVVPESEEVISSTAQKVIKVKKDMSVKDKKPATAKKPKEKPSKVKFDHALVVGIPQSPTITSSSTSKLTVNNTLCAKSIVNTVSVVASVVPTCEPLLFVPSMQTPVTSSSDTLAIPNSSALMSACSTASTIGKKFSDIGNPVPCTSKSLGCLNPPTTGIVKCTAKKKNFVCTTEDVMGMIESITTATAKLEMERGKKTSVKADLIQPEATPPKKKKKKPSTDSEGSPTGVTGLRDYGVRAVCEDCGRGLATAYNLRRHMRNVHNKVLPTSNTPSSAGSAQIEQFVSPPFDNSIPQLHIADDEEPFPTLDDTFLNPPLLSPPNTVSLEKLSACISLPQSENAHQTSDALKQSSELSANALLETENQMLGFNGASLGRTSEESVSLPSKNLGVSDMFNLCSSMVGDVKSPMGINITSEETTLQNGLLCDNANGQMGDGVMCDSNVFYPNITQGSGSSIKTETIDVQQPQPSISEVTQSTDSTSLERWMKPNELDMDFFNVKTEQNFISDSSDLGMRSSIDSDPLPAESVKYEADLSKFEAINERNQFSQEQPAASKSVTDTEIRSEQTYDTHVLDTFFETAAAYGLENQKSSYPMGMLDLQDNVKTENLDSNVNAFSEGGRNSGISFHDNFCSEKENSYQFSVMDPGETLFETQPVIKLDEVENFTPSSCASTSEVKFENLLQTESVGTSHLPLCKENTKEELKNQNCVETVQESKPELTFSNHLTNENSFLISDQRLGSSDAESRLLDIEPDVRTVVEMLLCSLNEMSSAQSSNVPVSKSHSSRSHTSVKTVSVVGKAGDSQKQIYKTKSGKPLKLNELQVVLKKCKTPGNDSVRRSENCKLKNTSPSKKCAPSSKFAISERNGDSVVKTNAVPLKITKDKELQSNTKIRTGSSVVPTYTTANQMSVKHNVEVPVEIQAFVQRLVTLVAKNVQKEKVAKASLKSRISSNIPKPIRKPSKTGHRSIKQSRNIQPVVLKKMQDAVSINKSQHCVQSQSVVSTTSDNDIFNSAFNEENRQSVACENHRLHIKCEDVLDDLDILDGKQCAEQEPVVELNTSVNSDKSCFISNHEPCVKLERNLLDLFDAPTFMDTHKSKVESSGSAIDGNCIMLPSKNSSEFAVAVRGSSRIRDNKAHSKRMCLCCVESAPSPSPAKKCRTNSGSSNGSNGTSASVPVVPLVPIKIANSKTVSVPFKKQRKQKQMSKIHTRSTSKPPRTRSTIVP